MDFYYILQNTIIYWIMAFVITNIFSSNKYLNFAIGSFFIFFWYVIIYFQENGFSIQAVLFIISSFLIFYYLDKFIVKSFINSKKRELFWIIFTLGFAILLENVLYYKFGPNSISINNGNIDIVFLWAVFMVLFIFTYYFYKISLSGKILKWLHEDAKVIDTLWINVEKLKFFNMFFSFILLFIASYIALTSSSLNIGANLFFLLKWIGIMIIVWINKIEYIFLWALLYVFTEHILFINLWVPIWYKDSLILIIILFILIIKPNGVLNFNLRKI